MSGLSRIRQNCFGVRTPILSPQPPAGSTAATVPGLLPGSARAADNRDSRIAEPAPAGPLTQCPGSAGLLYGPSSIASRAQNPEVQMGTVSETPTPALGRDRVGLGQERRRADSGKVASGADRGGSQQACCPSLGPAPQGSALPALPSIPPGWPS